MRKVVLMCSHNGERFIKEQIASITNQSATVDLLFVYDFASSDGTRVIVREMASIYTRTKIILREFTHAPGAALSFFRALEEILPELNEDDCVFLADQDDVWLPNKVEIISQEFARARRQLGVPTLTFHDVAIVNHHLTIIKNSFYVRSPFKIPRDLDPERLLLANPIVGHSVAVSTDLISLVCALDQKKKYLMHDWACVLVASRFGQIVFHNCVLSNYRQHDANVLGAHGRHGLKGIVARLKRHGKRVSVQAHEFIGEMIKAQSAMNPAGIREFSIDLRLKKLHSRGGIPWQYALAKSAIKRGPTPKRKLLAAFIFMCGNVR